MNVNPASPQIARAINDRMALDLLIEHGELTAPQLKELTGLSRPSVSDLLERLQENELIEVVGEAGGKRRGPNAKLYGVIGDRAHVAGVDLRGGAIDVSIADLRGITVSSSKRTISDNRSLAALIRRAVADAGRKVSLDPEQLHTVVIGAPGFVDQETGDLIPGYEFPGWSDTLFAELVDALNVPIAFESEVNLAGTAELHRGAGQGRRDLALLWLDRSVGASIIMDGRLRQGASGGAGEVGKFAMPNVSLPIAGRAAGGLHSLVSASAVRRLALAHRLPEGPLAEVVATACTTDDHASNEFVSELAQRIAMGVLGVVAVVDPGLVVLSGDIGLAGDERLAVEVSHYLSAMDAIETEVASSTVKKLPVVSGAILAALTIAHDDIFGGSRELVAMQQESGDSEALA